jgi:hypothetical protein
MIAHDATVIPGWEDVSAHQIGSVVFERDDECLTILNVNRTPIEKTVGVDLIYYNHSYQAYVMVQYKRMTHHPGTGWFFRPTEAQCKEELDRMLAFKEVHPDSGTATVIREYRLSSECFYFKLCESVTFNPFEGGLIQGMYVPLDYWRLLLQAPEVKGRGGGVNFTYESVQRHLNNTQFIEIMQRGWIGSRARTTHVITDLIKKSLQGNRSAIVGIAQRQRP